MSNWFDFSNAEEQQSFDVIPHRTPVKVHMKIRPGGYDDPSQGWTGGYATRSERTGAVYLNAEFTVIGGRYNKRKVFSNIGLYSANGPRWGNMGRSFIRAALESARGVKADDASDKAMKARQISGFQDLDGLEFAALVEVQQPTDQDRAAGRTDPRNVIQTVIGVGHKDYAELMGGGGGFQPVGNAAANVASSAAAAATGGGTKPAWLD